MKSLLHHVTDIFVIDQALGQDAEDGWILTKFFLGVFMDRGGLTKRDWGQYSTILTETAWSKKDFLFGFWGNFSHGTRRVVPSGQDSAILPALVANHSVRFGSSCPLTELAI